MNWRGGILVALLLTITSFCLFECMLHRQAEIKLVNFLGFQAATRRDEANFRLGHGIERGLTGGRFGENNQFGFAQQIILPPFDDTFPRFVVGDSERAEVHFGMGIFPGVKEKTPGELVEVGAEFFEIGQRAAELIVIGIRGDDLAGQFILGDARLAG
jgi:hypothetical protein